MTKLTATLPAIGPLPPDPDDVISLYRNDDREKLDKIVVCRNESDNVTAYFGDLSWNIAPLLRTKNRTHDKINFTSFQAHHRLLYEFRLFCYGWLYLRNKRYSTPTKASTVITRASGLKTSYQFLAENNLESLVRLSEPDIWQRYLCFLEAGHKSAGTLVHILCAFQQAQRLYPWMKIDDPGREFSPTELSQKLCRAGAASREQTLVIPEQIADKILHRAVDFVETAWCYREALGKTEYNLQENYYAGENIVRDKIRTGQWKWLTHEGSPGRGRHNRVKEIFTHTPHLAADIIAGQLSDYPYYAPGNDGSWWHQHRANLMASCFICCAAFSGMRESELFELTSESYYSAEYDGKLFHFLKGKTHKLGEKRTEWVVAPVVEKAVALACALTAHLRRYLHQHASTPQEHHWADCLWLSQGQRSSLPKRISSWRLRLSNFARNAGVVITEKDYEECLRSNPNSLNRIKRFVQVGGPWLLTPHQFRRTLAWFAIKNRLGNAVAIKQQFKHLYLQMSEWYCEGGLPSRLDKVESDTELQHMIDTIHDEQVATRYWSWFHGSSVLSGSHGKEIVKMRSDLPVLFGSWESVYQLVRSKKLTLHGTLHGYCKNGYDCDMGGVVNPAFCVNCGTHGSIIDEEQAVWWQKKHTALTHYLKANQNVSVAVITHCLTQIRAAEQVMNDFSIPYDRWIPSIEVWPDE